MKFKHRTGLWDLSDKVLIAGILNVTPDSFSDSGKYSDIDTAVKRAAEMISEGADFIDIGGESTRPGAESVSIDEEIKRVIPVIKNIFSCNKTKNAIISIDTTKYEVAKAAIEAGAHIINDISAFSNDERMFALAAQTGAGVILMHIKGTPKTMQEAPHYNNVVQEICVYLKEKFNKAVSAGIDPENIALDPGIGFGKTIENNFEIIRGLKRFSEELKRPILIGASRKSFIGKTLNADVDNRLAGSLAVAIISAINGARILRVHDVKETRQAIEILYKTQRTN